MKRKQRLYLLIYGLVLSTFVITIGLCHRQAPGFTLKKITSPFEPSSKWAIDNLNEIEEIQLQGIMNQDFNYLGAGAQCYAFLSADGNYVLKFFKVKHLVPKRWLKLIPFPGLGSYRFNKIDKRILRHRELFTSYKIAYEELKDETGLVYIHLNKTKDLKTRINLYDRIRNCYRLDLDNFEFIIQRRAQLVRDRITSHMQKGHREEAAAAIHSLLKQVVLQCQKGFIDSDSGVSHNYGFVDDTVIHFDAGRIAHDDAAKKPAYYQREVLRVSKKLEDWLKEQYPVLLQDVEDVISSMIDPSLQS